MAIMATRGSEGGNFEPAPAGVHQAVCVDVIDKGILEVTYAGQTKKQHKIVLSWQIDETRDDGKPFLVSKRYTLSLNEKATLRKDLESWRGKAFTREDEMGFDVESVIGANCLLNIQHKTTGERTYANVVSIMPLVKGMDRISAKAYVRMVDRTPEQQETEPGGGMPDDSDIPFSRMPNY
jgi:hypothetical protein